MSQKKCRAAFEGRLATWAAARSPALRISYQNVPFTPAAGETYLKAFLLPADTTSDDLAGDHTAYRGVFQVSVVGPINKGSGAVEGIAEEMEALFYTNLQLSVSSLLVQQITPARVAPALQDESTYTVPVSFSYRSDSI